MKASATDMKANIDRGGGLGGAWGGRAPPRIQDLCSKFFENCQNLIFHIIRAPLSKICSPAPVYDEVIFYKV